MVILHFSGVVVSTPGYGSAGSGSVPAWAVGAQLTHLFILPFKLVDKWVTEESLGR